MKTFFLLFGVMCCVELVSAQDIEGEEDKRAVIDQLIWELGEPEYLTREAAEKALVEIGQEAFPQLAQAAREPFNLEMEYRAYYAMGMIQQNYLTQGTHITFRAHDASARTVFQELSALGETEIALGESFQDSTISVDYQHISFWEAVIDACRKSGNKPDLVMPTITINAGAVEYLVAAGPLLIEFYDMRTAYRPPSIKEMCLGLSREAKRMLFLQYLVYCEDSLRPTEVRNGTAVRCAVGSTESVLQRGVVDKTAWARKSRYCIASMDMEMPPDATDALSRLTIDIELSAAVVGSLNPADLRLYNKHQQPLQFTFFDLPMRR